jgi:hypothetical protein
MEEKINRMGRSLELNPRKRYKISRWVCNITESDARCRCEGSMGG